MPDCTTDNGSLGARKPYLPKEWVDRTGLWCNDDDFVCGSAKFPPRLSGHAYDDEGGAIADAAQEAVTRLSSRLTKDAGPEPEPDPEPVGGGEFNMDDFDTGRELIGEGTTGLDIVFVLDSTGSMSSTIEAAKDYAATMADEVKQLRGRVALVEYRDAGDEFVSRVRTDFTDDTTRLDEELGEIVAAGGGDEPEALLHALMTAFNELHWRDGATKAAIVLTDTSYHDPDVASGVTTEEVAARSLEIDPVNVYPVVPTTAGGQYAELAKVTSGEVVEDTESTLDAIEVAMTKLAERPVALLALREYWATPGLEVSFDASSSYAHHGRIESYEWDFDGDGTFERTTTTPQANHTYAKEFDGNMQVVVRDSEGGIANMSVPVHVLAPAALNAKFTPPPPARSVRAAVTSGKTSRRATVTVSWSPPAANRPDRWVVAMNGFVLGSVPGTRTSLAVTKVDRASPVTFTVTPADEERELLGTAVSARTKAWTSTTAKALKPTRSGRARVKVTLKDASSAVPTGKVIVQARAVGKKKWRQVATKSFTRANAGKRTMTLRKLPKGRYRLRVTYVGNPTFEGSRAKQIRLRLRR